MKEILRHLFEYKSFSRKEAYEILTNIATGKYDTHQIAAFMTAYGMRSIRVEELGGFRDAMYDLCLKMDFQGYDLIDMCGTGGDGKNTFNISTLASFVVAGAGYKVAKHGNVGVSSGCGSSNVMEYLGYQFTNDKDTLQKQLDESNICFLHAPLFHPAMKTVAPIRRALGVKTFFNMLGPLTNPANPKFQSVGVFSLELARLYGYLYQNTEKQYSIIHALDGYDEISLTGDFKVINNQGESYYSVEEIGFEAVKAEDLAGGDNVEEAAKIFREIIEGKGNTVQNNVVLTNAAFAIKTFHPEKTFGDCYYEAEESLLGLKALDSLKKLTNA
jgi:anthranilate phosphoribosyltransferase